MITIPKGIWVREHKISDVQHLITTINKVPTQKTVGTGKEREKEP